MTEKDTEKCCVMVRPVVQEPAYRCDGHSILVIEGKGYCRQHIQGEFRKNSRYDDIAIREDSIKREIIELTEKCKDTLQFITNDTLKVSEEMVKRYLIQKIEES